jgi:hypothetical protein
MADSLVPDNRLISRILAALLKTKLNAWGYRSDQMDITESTSKYVACELENSSPYKENIELLTANAPYSSISHYWRFFKYFGL